MLRLGTFYFSSVQVYRVHIFVEWLKNGMDKLNADFKCIGSMDDVLCFHLYGTDNSRHSLGENVWKIVAVDLLQIWSDEKKK